MQFEPTNDNGRHRLMSDRLTNPAGVASSRGLAELAEAADEELARRHIEDFLRRVNPRYERARHTALLCQVAERASAGDARRQIVMIPPRSGKTLHLSQALPAFHLGRYPRDQVIIASYGAELAEANSRRAREFMKHPLYPFLTAVSPESFAVGRWHTTDGGAVIAAGVGGGITGFGADLLLIDDPLKDREEADSLTKRDSVWHWYTEAALPRLMPGGSVVVVMTRWHEDDLVGRILNSLGASEWEITRLPALAEEDDPLGRAPSEPLWPEWYPLETLLSLKDDLGTRAFAALYQQRPTPETGSIIKRQWLEGRYDTLPPDLRIIQTIDTAFKKGPGNDYSVIATWGCDRQNFYPVDIWRRKVEYPDLVRAVRANADKHNPREIYIEDAGSGQSLYQDLRRTTKLAIIKRTPRASKEVRLAVVSPLFEAGKVLLPRGASFLDEWIEEHVSAPNGRYDDQVDTTTLALEELRRETGPRVRGWHYQPPRRWWESGYRLGVNPFL